MASDKHGKTENGEGTVRVSVSFPAEHYERLKWIADHNKVSVAWVVRRAVEKHLSDETPLLDQP